MKFVLLINLKLLTIANSFLLNMAGHDSFFLQIDMKIPTIIYLANKSQITNNYTFFSS